MCVCVCVLVSVCACVYEYVREVGGMCVWVFFFGGGICVCWLEGRSRAVEEKTSSLMGNGNCHLLIQMPVPLGYSTSLRC